VTPFRPPPSNYARPSAFAPPSGLAKVHGLAIGYAAFGGLLLMLGLTFVGVGVFLATRPPPVRSTDAGLPMAMVVTESVMMLTFGGLLGLGAFSLYRRKAGGLVTAAACLACLFFPFGTVLGVLTFLWLKRPDVKSLLTDSNGKV
jgi:hypothetical protein